ncbi:hypothetical protein P170DRAFT_418765 [Aspergillus steynii IBT 23096]|uniref:Uncharacterized protein n=1 Tax=Aspergillus steynii IBT 23096 TaxID=1392250 RepID=A0A2I2FR64_9EURO|nr:uncharacterized protein P170DRAFT_418765 [Aspergillus steynii IBT 23096]PLB43099.1 hypothetical protein P170DRAFT_418765 [Aspergillus steynii IBT 23096]
MESQPLSQSESPLGQPPGGAPAHEDTVSKFQPSMVEQFERLGSYPFSDDPEFSQGLSVILGHPNVPVTETELMRDDDLVLRAKCFYYSRKERLAEPLNFLDYKAWLRVSSPLTTSPGSDGFKTVSEQTHSPSKQIPAPAQQEPSYPSSFAHIVDLITSGKPVPGIQQIPDTVLMGHDTPSTKPKRRKPWENESGETHDMRPVQG